MSEISRTALFGKLNSLAYKAIDGATVFSTYGLPRILQNTVAPSMAL